MLATLPRTVGFELEFAGTNPVARRIRDVMVERGYTVDWAGGWRKTEPSTTKWDLKTDASCGFEAVSPIISTVSELEKAVKVATIVAENGGTVNPRCSLHVHVGIQDYGAEREKIINLMRFLVRYEDAFFLLADDSRQHNRYCQRIPSDMVNRLRLLERAHGSNPRSWQSVWTDRTFWVNGETWNRTGTLEFRIMHGMLDPKDIFGYCLFLLSVVDELEHGREVRWGRATARDGQSLVYTLLQQAGMYNNPRDNDRATASRKWALSAFKAYGKRRALGERVNPLAGMSDNDACDNEGDGRDVDRSVEERIRAGAEASFRQAEQAERERRVAEDLRRELNRRHASPMVTFTTAASGSNTTWID